MRAFEASITADTAQNLLCLRAAVHAQLASYARYGMPTDFATVNQWVYAFLFRTPAEDAWLGLATPTTFTGLPRSGLTE